jgi:tryptophan 2,3-dioxygenase
MYRRMEFLLGEKPASMLVSHRGMPEAHDELAKALSEPSLDNEKLRYLDRHEYALPAEVLERDFTQRYEPAPVVEKVWQDVYAGPRDSDSQCPGEALTEVGEVVWRSRNEHLVATRRALGAKSGTGGCAGVAWLEKRAAKAVFPELSTARSHA